MRVRRASVDDVAAVAALEAESFAGDEWTVEYLRAALEGRMPTVRVLVAEEDGVVLGHAIMSVVFEIAELQRIAVSPAHRRQGYATALLDGVLSSAAEAGAERLLLEVREHNAPALMFYRRAGFAEIDRRERYYRDGTTAVILQVELHQPPPGQATVLPDVKT